MKKLMVLFLILNIYNLFGEETVNYRKFTVMTKIGNAIKEPKNFLIPTDMEEGILRDEYILDSNNIKIGKDIKKLEKNKEYSYVYEFEVNKIKDKKYYIDMYVNFPLNSIDGVVLCNYENEYLSEGVYLNYELQPDNSIFISHEYFEGSKAYIVIKFNTFGSNF